MCRFVILAASVVVICLFQGCLTLWIIRAAAVVVSAKGEVVA